MKNLEPFTSLQVEEYLKANESKIQAAVDEMIHAYEEDGELDDLWNREADWVREFLYEKINIEDFLPVE